MNMIPLLKKNLTNYSRYFIIFIFTLCSCLPSKMNFLNLQKGNKTVTYVLEFPYVDLSQVISSYEKRFQLAGLTNFAFEHLENGKQLGIQISGLQDPELLLPLIVKQGLFSLRFVQKDHPAYLNELKKLGIKNLNQELSSHEWKMIQALQNKDPKVNLLRQEIQSGTYRIFLIENESQLDHSAIKELSPYPKRSQFGFFPQPPLRGILITLNQESKAQFAKITRENVGNELAFIVDDEVIQAPRIMEEIKEGQVMLDYGQAGLSKELDYLIGLNAVLISAPLENKPQLIKVLQKP